jgi:hypothetical protein
VSGRPGRHSDGFQWQQGLISNAGGRTLVDPNGHHVAHVYRCEDHTYRAVLADGRVLAEGLLTAADALKRVDNEMRPCAHLAAVLVRGLVQCDREREPGSVYCTEHAAEAAAWS